MSCLPNILLTDNYNVTDINWKLNIPKSNPQHGMEINETICDIFAEHNLSQCNEHRTRLNNILDLLCSTSLDLMKSIHAYPGMDTILKLGEDDTCAFCKTHKEDLSHFFWTCEKTTDFWKKTKTLVNQL